jgi:hypothetical protein
MTGPIELLNVRLKEIEACLKVARKNTPFEGFSDLITIRNQYLSAIQIVELTIKK